jgi:hypothetical protein
MGQGRQPVVHMARRYPTRTWSLFTPNDSSPFAGVCNHAYFAECIQLVTSEYRRLAAPLTRTADKEALDLSAIGWDKVADNHQATLHNVEQFQPT